MGRENSLRNLKPWKPGQTGNPAGQRGVLPPEIRAERKRNQSALIRLVSHLFTLTDKEAKARSKAPGTNQLEKAAQALIAKARDGDVLAFKYLMELMVGKIPEHDYDGFTEEDIRILNRVKEVFEDQKRIADTARPSN